MNRDIMIQAGLSQAVERVEAGVCATCAGEVGPFRDDLSIKEYRIGGMCQTCQDKVFGMEDY